MQRLVIIIVVVLLVGGGVYLVTSGGSGPAPVQSRAIAKGDLAPDFQLEDTQGKQVSLSSLRGKVVLVNFWATWCPPCREEMPSMEKLHETMAGEDFVILALNTEKNGKSVVPNFLAKTPYSFPILFDHQATAQEDYGVYKFPETFVIRKDGTVDQKIIGGIDWAKPSTIAYFKSLARG